MIQLRPGPEVADGFILCVHGHIAYRNLLYIAFASCLAGYSDGAGWLSAPFAEQDQRLLGIQDGGRGGGYIIYVEPAIIYRDSGQKRGFYISAETFRVFLRVRGIRHGESLAETALGDSFDQVIVHGAAYAEREEAGCAHVLVDQVIDLAFVGDIAVRDDDDAPGEILVHRDGDGFIQRGQQGGSAAAFLVIDELHGHGHVLRVGREGLG